MSVNVAVAEAGFPRRAGDNLNGGYTKLPISPKNCIMMKKDGFKVGATDALPTWIRQSVAYIWFERWLFSEHKNRV